jgi:hypothetical protein
MLFFVLLHVVRVVSAKVTHVTLEPVLMTLLAHKLALATTAAAAGR